MLQKVITPAGEVATEFLGVGLAALARTASLTAGLLLTPTNSRDDPGYASEWELYRRNHHGTPLTPDQLRLAQLERLHEQGDLAADEEEAELIALLAKVKGIHVRKLADLQGTVPGRTLPSRLPDPNARPRGVVTRINPNNDTVTQDGLTRENESAVLLAQAGYDVEQNPNVLGTRKKPDYKIEGKVFDCYAPNKSSPRAIWSSVSEKIEQKQTQRIILNLDNSSVSTQALRDQFSQYPIPNLEEIIIIKQGQIVHFLP